MNLYRVTTWSGVLWLEGAAELTAFLAAQGRDGAEFQITTYVDEDDHVHEVYVGHCSRHGEYEGDATDSPCPSCEDEDPIEVPAMLRGILA